MSETSCMQIDNYWMCLNCLCVNLVGSPQFSQEPWEGSYDWKLAGIFIMLSLLRKGFFNRGETRGDLKCEGKEPSESDKLTIDVISVIRMSMSFTEVVGIGSKSDDLHGASRTRRQTSSAVTQVRFLQALPGIRRIQYLWVWVRGEGRVNARVTIEWILEWQ